MKSTAYSVLDLVIVSDGKNYKQTLEDTITLAQNIESFGYTRMWFAEHHNMPAVASNAPQILIGHIAQATQTLRVGSGGIMLPNHSPLIISEQFGTLGTLFPGRIDLGLGRAPGTDQATAAAIRPDFVQAAHSFPKEVESIQQYFSIENKHSKVRTAIAEGVDVPIFILGSSTASAHLAAKKGLTYAFASHFATAQLFQAMEVYRAEFTPSAILKTPYVMTGINVIVADTDEEAQWLASSFIQMIISMVTNNRRESLAKPMELTAQQLEIQRQPVVQQMIQFTFIGNKMHVKNQIREFIEQTKTDELIVVSAIHDAEKRIKSYKYLSEIMKELHDE